MTSKDRDAKKRGEAPRCSRCNETAEDHIAATCVLYPEPLNTKQMVIDLTNDLARHAKVPEVKDVLDGHMARLRAGVYGAPREVQP